MDHIHSINKQTYQQPIAKYKEGASNSVLQYWHPLQMVFTISQIKTNITKETNLPNVKGASNNLLQYGHPLNLVVTII
jgi:hypothetical protein